MFQLQSQWLICTHNCTEHVPLPMIFHNWFMAYLIFLQRPRYKSWLLGLAVDDYITSQLLGPHTQGQTLCKEIGAFPFSALRGGGLGDAVSGRVRSFCTTTEERKRRRRLLGSLGTRLGVRRAFILSFLKRFLKYNGNSVTIYMQAWKRQKIIEQTIQWCWEKLSFFRNCYCIYDSILTV